jgi:hypothetical protein
MLFRHSIALLVAAGVLTWLVLAPVVAEETKPAAARQVAPAKPADGKQSTAGPSQPAPVDERKHITETLRGKVVWLADALERQFGVRTEADAARSAVVLETAEGRLVPLVPDTRGWAFTVDDRLRDVELELRVRRYEHSSYVQVIRVLKRRQGELYEIDYWCDVCAIPMFILKPCECCQGETRLREQKLDDTPALPAPAAAR